VNFDQACAAIVEGGSGSEPAVIGILAERRLSVAAIAALLLNDPRRTLASAARGTDEVRAAIRESQPAVLVIEGHALDWDAVLEPTGWDGNTLLLLDPEDEPGAYVRAVRSGAQGYLSRSASGEALETAIERVSDSGYYLDPLLAGRIFQASGATDTAAVGLAKPELSQREYDILTRIAKGLSSKQIAAEYGVTAKTVCNHVSNIYAKLNVRHRGQLVLYAVQQGLTTL
jgi:DNA-binding NarL/FixJ family response regulator